MASRCDYKMGHPEKSTLRPEHRNERIAYTKKGGVSNGDVLCVAVNPTRGSFGRPIGAKLARRETPIGLQSVCDALAGRERLGIGQEFVAGNRRDTICQSRPLIARTPFGDRVTDR